MNRASLVIFVSFLVGHSAYAQQPTDPAKVQIKVKKLSASVAMLEGQGGNIGVSVGDDGMFVVDDQFAPLTPKIQAALATLSTKPIRFVLNTHWHGDHTGGNENFRAAGAVIVAQENVRKRMSVEQFIELLGKKVPASPVPALPLVTFTRDVTFHLNGDEINVFHIDNAHTDGDAIVHFKKANVIHMGDCYVSASFPFVDLSSGGNIDGFIAAADRALALANDKTQFISGHGPSTGKAELKAWRDMVVKIRERVAKAIAQGKQLADIQKLRPTAEYDAKFGKGFIKPEILVDMVYRSLAKPKQ